MLTTVNLNRGEECYPGRDSQAQHLYSTTGARAYLGSGVGAVCPYKESWLATGESVTVHCSIVTYSYI